MNISVSCQKASLYVGDLHPDVIEDMLYHKFSPAGTILSVRVCRDRITKRSLRYGYVNFKQSADARRALDTMNFEELKGRPVRIMWSQRDNSIRKSGVGNVYVNNLEKDIDSRALLDTFSAFGNILSCKVACDARGSKGYGFVHFETQEAADRAIQRLNGLLFNDRLVFVGRFKSRQQRKVELQQEKQDRMIQHKGINLYVKNLDDQIDDERLRDAFSSFGNVISAKVMMHGGRSKGFGFVSLSSPEEANKALTEINGRIISTKPLYVAPAQSRTQRQTYLTNRYVQRRASVGTVSYQPAPPSGDFMAAIPEAQNRTAYHPNTQLAQVRPCSRQETQGISPQHPQNIPGAMPPSALSPKTFNTMTPNSQVTRMMSTLRVSSQTVDPAPCSDAAPVLGASQPKCDTALDKLTALDKPLQHMDAQPKLATSVLQPAVRMQSQKPLTDSMLATAPPQVQKQMLDERLIQIQAMLPSLVPKLLFCYTD